MVLRAAKINTMLDNYTINSDKECGALVGVFEAVFQWCEPDVRCLVEDKGEGWK